MFEYTHIHVGVATASPAPLHGRQLVLRAAAAAAIVVVIVRRSHTALCPFRRLGGGVSLSARCMGGARGGKGRGAGQRGAVRCGQLGQALWCGSPLSESGLVLQEEYCGSVYGPVVHVLPEESQRYRRLVPTGPGLGPTQEDRVSPVPLTDVLAARAVLVLVGGDGQLVPQEATSLHAGQSWSHGVPPLRDEDDEGQRLRGLVQQLLTGTGTTHQFLDTHTWTHLKTPEAPHLKVGHHGIHQLLTERRVGLKGATDRTEGQEGPGHR